MGLFWKRKKEIRAEPSGEQVLTFGQLLRSVLGSDARPVTEQEAMSIPAVAGCVEFITALAASVPVKLYEAGEEEEHEISDDSRLRVINEDTGDLLTGPEWKKAFFRDYLLKGRAWAYQRMRRNELKSLHYVDDSSVSVMTNEDPIYKKAVVWVGGKAYQPYQFLHMARNTKNGVQGEGLLSKNKGLLNLELNYMEFENSLVAAGGNKRGFLESEHRLTDAQITGLKEGFQQLYNNDRESVIVLNAGVKFNPAQATSVELQMAENKEANRKEICSLFCLPVSIIEGKASPEEFSQAIQVAVLPILQDFTSACNRTLLLENEKGSKHFDCDTRDLQAGDVAKRYKAYTEACRAGWITKNEIRYREKFKPVDGLDVVNFSLGEVVYDVKTKKYYVPNTGEELKLEEGHGQEGEEEKSES